MWVYGDDDDYDDDDDYREMDCHMFWLASGPSTDMTRSKEVPPTPHALVR